MMKQPQIPLGVILHLGGSLHMSLLPKNEEWLAKRQSGKETGAFLLLPLVLISNGSTYSNRQKSTNGTCFRRDNQIQRIERRHHTEHLYQEAG